MHPTPQHRTTPRVAAALAIHLLLATVALPGFAPAATITVDTLDDNLLEDGACSLREAIGNADSDSGSRADCTAGDGDDIIGFDVVLFSGSPSTATIALGSTLYIGSGGGPDGAMTIAAPPGHRIVLSGNGAASVMAVDGRANPFTLADAEVRGGRASLGAGAFLTTGRARFERVRFIDNQASGSFGGGAIYRNVSSAGTIELLDCQFEGNAAPGGAGGAISLLGPYHELVVSGSSFLGNSSLLGGGAMRLQFLGLTEPGIPGVTITGTRFEGNASEGNGGAIEVIASQADARVAASVTGSLFRENVSVLGGGAIAFNGSPSGNQQDLAIRSSSFIGNWIDSTGFRSGGAIAAYDAGLSVENSLFLDNRTSFSAAAIKADLSGTAVPRALALVGNSFRSNLIDNEGASNGEPRTLELRAPADATGWSWTLSGNLFSAPIARVGSGDECLLSGDPAVMGGGNNLASEASCALLATDTEADPMVLVSSTGDPLAPRAVLPQSGSAAIDAWPAAACLGIDGLALDDDLRGAARPGNGDGLGGADCDIGAFELPDAGLVTVALNGSGNGRVVSQPAGIDCGATCSAGFGGGTQLLLTAAAEPGSVFTGWSGDCSGDQACALEVAGDRSVTASFALASAHQLDVQLDGDGHGSVASAPSGIACEPLCSASFSDGASITLSASADPDSVFDGWSGGGCSGTGDCVLALAADTTVSASFTATQFALGVGLVGGGSGSVASDLAGIDCPEDCQALFDRTDVVTLTATADANSSFVGWEGDCASAGSGDCALDMDLGPYGVDARFERLRTLSVGLLGGGGGSVTSTPAGIACPGTCDGTWINGTEVALSASPAIGSVFAGWSGACSGTGSCVLDLTGNFDVDAIFQTASFALGVTMDGGGSVTSTPAGISCPSDCTETWLAGTEVELVATPAPNFDFAGWTGACSGTASCTVTMDQARSVGASFTASTVDVFADGFEP